MPTQTIRDLEADLRRLVKHPEHYAPMGCLYVETGRYKPYGPATLLAAKRRGHIVTPCGGGVFHVAPGPAFSAAIKNSQVAAA